MPNAYRRLARSTDDSASVRMVTDVLYESRSLGVTEAGSSLKPDRSDGAKRAVACPTQKRRDLKHQEPGSSARFSRPPRTPHKKPALVSRHLAQVANLRQNCVPPARPSTTHRVAAWLWSRGSFLQRHSYLGRQFQSPLR
jgi:hypothetical protein